ncbi:MAG: TolC family protein [Bacteroidota bacterium]
MSNRLRAFWVILHFLGVMGLSLGQVGMSRQEDPLPQLPDTTYFLSLSEFLEGVLQYHPVAKQSDLLAQEARFALQSARGGFDPVLYGYYDDKQFKESNYWRIFDGGISMPTQIGVEVKAGFLFQDGDFLNAERSIPSDGQVVLGAKVPLGQGLLIDARRAALQQAKIFQQENQIEQWLMLNQLLYEASLSYWEWALAFSQLELFDNAASAAQERFVALKNTFLAGDAAGIDTVEAFTQMQQFIILRSEAELATELSLISLNTFLWNMDSDPITLPAFVNPFPLEEGRYKGELRFDDPQELLIQLDKHPEIQKIQLKLASLEVDRRFKADKLKPKLDLNYNVLSNTVTEQEISSTYSLSTENYKWGLSLNFPLFLRRERGDLAQTKVKIRNNELYQENKFRELGNKILAYAEQVQVLQEQVALIEEQVANYSRLYQGEIQKFQAGESTLFLINSRQQKLIEAQQKQLDLMWKFRKAQTSLDWISGLLYTP